MVSDAGGTRAWMGSVLDRHGQQAKRPFAMGGFPLRRSTRGRGQDRAAGRSFFCGVTFAPGLTLVRPLMTMVSSPFRPLLTTR